MQHVVPQYIVMDQKFSHVENVIICTVILTVWKVYKYEVCSGPYFPVFELNTEIYRVNLSIQSEYRKIRIWTLLTQWLHNKMLLYIIE